MLDRQQGRASPILLCSICCVLAIAGCGGGGGSDGPAGQQTSPIEVSFSGAVQKGPFIVGSTVTVNLLSETAENTGATIVTQTTDDRGSFAFITESQGLVQISSTGFFRNEIDGQLSATQLTLRSIDNPTTAEQRSNVNLLTHITSNRIRNIMRTTGGSFEQARNQAEAEFLVQFADILSSSAESTFTSLSIFDDGSYASAYLLAMSAVAYQTAINAADGNASNPSAEFALLLNELEADFGEDGVIDASLADFRAAIPQLDPSQIMDNVTQWASEGSQVTAADINDVLDSDLDGLINSIDDDDDNDGVEDSLDPVPFTPGFNVSDVEIETDEDTAVLLDLSTNSPGAGPITLYVTNAPQNGVLTGQYPEVTYVPDANFAGVDEFTYTLLQGSIVSEEATLQITVNPVTDAPLISGNPPTEVLANTLFTFTPAVLNIENAEISFSASSVPVWASFEEATGTLTGTPTNSDVGTYTGIQITVSDGALSTSLSPFEITVRANPWTTLPPMPTGRRSVAAAISGTDIYVIGGFRGAHLPAVEIYATDTETWRSGTPLQIARSGHTAHVIGDELFVVGGLNGDELASVEALSLTMGTWSSKSSMAASRNLHASCVYDDSIFVFGGFTDDGIPNTTNTESLASVEVYDPMLDVWSSRSPMQAKNWGMTCVVHNDRIYLFGGAGNQHGYWVYRPDTDVWESGGDMVNSRRYGFAGGMVAGEIYLIGGYLTGFLDHTDELDPVNLEWTLKSSMPGPRANLGFVVHENRFYLFGGRNNSSNNLPLVEVYDPGLDGD